LVPSSEAERDQLFESEHNRKIATKTPDFSAHNITRHRNGNGWGFTTMRVTLSDLSQLPVDRLARLLMEVAAEDRTLLARLQETIGENNTQPPPAQPRNGKPEFLGESPIIRRISDMIERFARADEPILITGESGTGKELAARAIHDRSRRQAGPFVAVNCAAIPSNLVASELFGYEKGAFTGAAARTKGQIEHAHGGTLFLDEIGDMPVELQGHLLRFLQEGQIVRVGGREVVDVDVRVVAATNVRLRQAIADGRFREDLYYRLNILSLPLPPLREHPEDIEMLAHHYLRQASRNCGREIAGFAPEAMRTLKAHSWPGNVRELMAVIRRAVVIGDEAMIVPADLVGLHDQPVRISEALPATATARPMPGSDEERAALLAALDVTQENITLTAQELGVSRVTLYRMLRRHAISLNRGLKAPPVMG
jgi:transcriptional regulator with PAS, ATPase and Fis domain